MAPDRFLSRHTKTNGIDADILARPSPARDARGLVGPPEAVRVAEGLSRPLRHVRAPLLERSGRVDLERNSRKNRIRAVGFVRARAVTVDDIAA